MTAENNGYEGEFEEKKVFSGTISEEDLENKFGGGCNGIACGNNAADSDSSYVFVVSGQSDEIKNVRSFSSGDGNLVLEEGGSDREEVVVVPDPEAGDQESPLPDFVEVQCNGDEMGGEDIRKVNLQIDEAGEKQEPESTPIENGEVGMPNVAGEIPAEESFAQIERKQEPNSELENEVVVKLGSERKQEEPNSESEKEVVVKLGSERKQEEPNSELENEVVVKLGSERKQEEPNSELENEVVVKLGSEESGETMQVHGVDCVDSKADVAHCPKSLPVDDDKKPIDSTCSADDVGSEPKLESISIEVRKSEPLSPENGTDPESEFNSTPLESQESDSACLRSDNCTVESKESSSAGLICDVELGAEDGNYVTEENEDVPADHVRGRNIEVSAGNDETIELKVGSVLVEGGESTTVAIEKDQPTNKVDSNEMVCKEGDDFKDDNKVDEATNDVPTVHADNAKIDSDAGSDTVALRDSEVYSSVENGSPHKKNNEIDMSLGENAVDSFEGTLSINRDDDDKIACREDSGEDIDCIVETNKDASSVETIVASVVDDQSVSTDEGDKLVCEEAVKQVDKDVVLQSPFEVSSTLALHDQKVETDVKPLPSPSEDPSSSDLHEQKEETDVKPLPSTSEDPSSSDLHEQKVETDVKPVPSPSEDPSGSTLNEQKVETDVKPVPSPSEDPSGSALHEQKVETDVQRLPCFIIRIPRFSDDKLKARIQLAQQQVEEKTQDRDSIRVTLQKQKGLCNEYWEKVEAARKEERAARDAVVSKRQEIDLILSTINKIKTANSIDDIDNRIHNLEHMMQHETIPLKEEKKLIREISQLKQNREQLTSNLASLEELEEAFDHRTQIEKRFELLKEELDSLKKVVVQAEFNTKTARRKHDDENQHYRKLHDEFNAADDVRQEAYTHLRGLKKKSFEKNQYFYTYKDDMKAATNYASSGDRETLQSHCSNQVEKVMDLWNKNDEFRKDYVKSNLTSTLRRFRTLDGRSLAPDEQPTVLHNVIDLKLKNGPLPSSKTELALPAPVPKQETLYQPVAPEMTGLEPPVKVIQNSQLTKSTKTTKGSDIIIATTVSGREEAEEHAEKKRKQTEEEELAKKAEELARKEEELKKEAELKERHRLEQIAKAKEAEERKRRKAEKDQAKALVRAQREAEVREKKRVKKEKKKKMTAPASDMANGGSEAESVVSESTPSQITRETEVKAIPSSKRPSTAVKNYKNKIKPLPLPLRNRCRRKMQTWMWVLLAVLSVLGLFLVGNYVSFSNFNLPGFGF